MRDLNAWFEVRDKFRVDSYQNHNPSGVIMDDARHVHCVSCSCDLRPRAVVLQVFWGCGSARTTADLTAGMPLSPGMRRSLHVAHGSPLSPQAWLVWLWGLLKRAFVRASGAKWNPVVHLQSAGWVDETSACVCLVLSLMLHLTLSLKWSSSTCWTRTALGLFSYSTIISHLALVKSDFIRRGKHSKPPKRHLLN